MKFLGLDIRRATAEVEDAAEEYKGAQFEDVLQRIVAGLQGTVGTVTPDNCMRSPTVHSIVTAVSRRLSVSSLAVYKKGESKGRDTKEKLPNHPVARLLQKPNSFQSRTTYVLDAVSTFMRHGKFYAYKSRGVTGPIRELLPLAPLAVCIEQDDRTWALSYKVTSKAGQHEYGPEKIHHVRGAARDFVNGDSPVKDVSTAIGLEIAAEEFGSSFFDNGALPLLIFKYMQGVGQTKDGMAEKQFIEDFQQKFTGRKRFRALMLPKGIERDQPIPIENDKAQFIESRKYQRTVIAGAFGVPPHLVGDLERATFNNVEQQDIDFTSNVVQPVATSFETAMERDLLTDEDRAAGVIIRFNLDSILRGDFKSRQEGLQIQRQNGVISPDEWRELEQKNPLPDGKGGDEYIRPANMLVAGAPVPEPKEKPKPIDDEGDTAGGQSP